MLVVFDPKIVSYEDLLKAFWENHDPTQGMRQGNDVGTQYRSGIYYYNESQHHAAEASRDMFQKELDPGRLRSDHTEIVPAPEFYYARITISSISRRILVATAAWADGRELSGRSPRRRSTVVSQSCSHHSRSTPTCPRSLRRWSVDGRSSWWPIREREKPQAFHRR